MDTHPMLDRYALVLQILPTDLGFYNEYQVLDEHGEHIGTVTESRPVALASTMRLVAAGLQLLPVALALRDASGAPVVRMSKAWGRMVTEVARGDGASLGCVRRRWRLGKARFELVRDDKTVGQVRARNWRATDFSVVDVTGREFARATKQRPEALQCEKFPSGAASYLIRLHARTAEPLRSFVVGALLALEAVVPHRE